jgi:hypothetical protein
MNCESERIWHKDMDGYFKQTTICLEEFQKLCKTAVRVVGLLAKIQSNRPPRHEARSAYHYTMTSK